MLKGRWLDHLPPWMALGAIASTGAFTALEVGAMAIPILAAAFVEWRSIPMHRFRRVLEIVALAVFVFQVAARTGVLATVMNTLFVLCGVRLCLPRELPQRRQLLLMGFLLFLTTAVSTSELDFLLWSILWVAGSALYLMQLNWEKSAQLRQGPPPAPPYRRVPAWTAAVLVLATGFFLVLPRLRMGVRSLPLGIQSLAGVHAGLSDVVDLSGRGPIAGGTDVAMRILPADRSEGYGSAFALLKGVVLEDLQGQRWEVGSYTPRRRSLDWPMTRSGRQTLFAEAFYSPSPLTVLALPYGNASLDPPEGEQLRNGSGASVKWMFPIRRILAVRIALEPQEIEPEPPPAGARLANLLHAGQGTECALRWSLRVAPENLPPRQLAGRLTRALRAFSYTLDNPSGGAGNPLEDFLERSRAGHCEFFASSLAIMLRRRGVPARVVNGYRLGPWIEEGGYFLVTQNEAHSWVEYYDDGIRAWRTADPTPAAPPSLASGAFMAALARMTDSIRFKWDRNVVRFSDADQVAGLDWIHARAGAIGLGRLRGDTALAALGALVLLGALFRVARRRPASRPGPGSPGRIREMRPLLRAARPALAPRPGETARAWLDRLGAERPERRPQLRALAREADAVAYGDKGRTALGRLAREEARHWKRPLPGQPE